MHPVLEREWPVAAAHRGSRLLWPENTMPAFQGAHDLGVRVFETDLHATSDGILVTFHDPTLDRTTDATGPIAARSVAELVDVDAGYHFEVDGDRPHRARGVGIPTLEEVATTFPDTAFVLDMKAPGIEALLAETIERLDLWDRVIVGSFRDARLRRLRRLTGGRVATSSGPVETLAVRTRSWLRRMAHSPADVFQVPVRAGVTVVDERFVDAAHRAGKHVHVWTINDEDEMRRLLDLGVDGLVTDRPDLLKGVLGR
ncbi:MAG: glycerophosphodiester phosphodiesterase [Acidimicrobiia bacterium]